MKKIIIIGVNHAGTAVVNTIAENGNSDWEITAYESNTNCSFLGCGIALWVSKKIEDPKGLFYSSPEALIEKGAKVFMEHLVEKVDFENKTVTIRNLKTNEVFKDTYDKLVISTGSTPIDLKLEGKFLSEYNNVMGIKLFQDAELLIERLKDPSIKHISIIGAGYIGIELAEAARINGREVTLIDQSPILLGNHYDEEFTSQIEEIVIEKGIKLSLGQKVESVISKNNNVTEIKTDKGIIKTDLVIASVGVNINTSWIDNPKLKKIRNGAIIVNQKQETSIKDVFAVGDCATVTDSITGEYVSIALASNAVRSGKVAGTNICCPKHLESFNPVQGSNAISIYGFNMVSTGLTSAAAKEANIDIEETYYEGAQKLAFMNEDHKVSIKVFYKKENREIVGAQMSSTYDISMAIHIFSLAIAKKVTIDELKFMDLFFLPHFNSPFNYINEVALKAKKQ